ncbi:hypothetical protein [Gordonia rhizosphera]|uniref:hypothetical protein n=1 Tax=Gordonia rhizosphera TaxID=83341 RepID=UPI003570EF7E
MVARGNARARLSGLIGTAAPSMRTAISGASGDCSARSPTTSTDDTIAEYVDVLTAS